MKYAGFRLAATVGFALVVFRSVDTGFYRLTERVAPRLALIADLRITSLILIAVIVFGTDARAVLSRPRWDAQAIPWIVGWLSGMVVSVHYFGFGRVPLPRWQDVVAFSFTVPLAEELLIRGLVLTAAARIWPPDDSGPSKGVLCSAATFAFMHLQYHSFHVDVASCSQMAWTLPFGVLTGWMVERTRSVWPSVALHVLNNALVQLV